MCRTSSWRRGCRETHLTHTERGKTGAKRKDCYLRELMGQGLKNRYYSYCYWTPQYMHCTAKSMWTPLFSYFSVLLIWVCFSWFQWREVHKEMVFPVWCGMNWNSISAGPHWCSAVRMGANPCSRLSIWWLSEQQVNEHGVWITRPHSHTCSGGGWSFESSKQVTLYIYKVSYSREVVMISNF